MFTSLVKTPTPRGAAPRAQCFWVPSHHLSCPNQFLICRNWYRMNLEPT